MSKFSEDPRLTLFLMGELKGRELEQFQTELSANKELADELNRHREALQAAKLAVSPIEKFSLSIEQKNCVVEQSNPALNSKPHGLKRGGVMEHFFAYSFILIAVVGGLLAVIGGQLVGSLDKSKIKEAKVQMREIGKALDLYYADCGDYPKTLSALVENIENCGDWGPDPYLSKAPKDPWGQKLKYLIRDNSFVIISYGADQKTGGEGKNKDILSSEL